MCAFRPSSSTWRIVERCIADGVQLRVRCRQQCRRSGEIIHSPTLFVVRRMSECWKLTEGSRLYCFAPIKATRFRAAHRSSAEVIPFDGVYEGIDQMVTLWCDDTDMKCHDSRSVSSRSTRTTGRHSSLLESSSDLLLPSCRLSLNMPF